MWIPSFRYEFDAVAERIGKVAMRFSIERNLVGSDPDAQVGQPLGKPVIVGASECWVGLLRRTEVGANAKVHVNIAAAEPATAALRQFWRFRHLLKSEHADVELACAVFFAARHGELDVIEAGERAVSHDTPLQFDSRLGLGQMPHSIVRRILRIG